MTNGLLLWPIYVNFSLEEWHAFEQEYADQAYLAASRTLMVNVLSNEPTAHGGAFDFRDGHIAEQFPTTRGNSYRLCLIFQIDSMLCPSLPIRQ